MHIKHDAPRSEKAVNAMNAELKDQLVISTQHTGPSHMWTAETLGYYLSFLTKEIRSRRKQLKLPFSARAMIMMDKAPQHSAAVFAQLRDRFEAEANCVLIHGESHDKVAIPAGSVSFCFCFFAFWNIYIYSVYIYMCVLMLLLLK